MTLALSATRPVNSRGRSAAAAAEIDKISKTVTVRPSLGASGEVGRLTLFLPPRYVTDLRYRSGQGL
jgi:hypothetical protein